MESVPGTTNEGTPFPGEPFFSLLRKRWTSLHRYFEPSRSHDWIVGVVVFYSSNPKCSECFDYNHSPQENQPHVDPSPSSPVISSSPSSLVRYSSISSSSPSESPEASNPMDKEKKKIKIKKKKKS
jgi:hypothetical protein